MGQEKAGITVLQIWSGPRPEAVVRDMHDTRMWAQRNQCRYVVIADQPMTECADEFISIDDYKRAVTDTGIDAWHVVEKEDLHIMRIVQSDLIRFHYAAHNAPVLYLDGDCVPLDDSLAAPGERSGFGRYGAAYDNYIISGVSPSLLVLLYEGLVERMKRQKCCAAVVDQHVVLNAVLDNRNDVYCIPDEMYLHRRGAN
jgi:hypothetical protein